jgi:hypothetical protein
MKFLSLISVTIGAALMTLAPPATISATEVKSTQFVSAGYSGQTGQTVQSREDRRRTESERDLDIRIFNLRALSELPHPAQKKRPTPEQALAQLQKDFTRLQIVNKDLLRAALGLGSGKLDAKFVTRSVTEIKERAERLNSALALPEIEKADEQTITTPTNPQDLKPSILRLGRVIFSFVDNPFFKEISVIDPQLTNKARRDLVEIIELSGEIRKASEKED